MLEVQVAWVARLARWEGAGALDPDTRQGLFRRLREVDGMGGVWGVGRGIH